MKALLTSVRIIFPTLILCQIHSNVAAQELIKMSETFQSGTATKVEVYVRLDGRLSVPLEQGKAPQLLPVSGRSHVIYEERALPVDESASVKTVRGYREVDFQRKTGSNQQDAGIRQSVRRMVIIKSANRRAPFSPDGPLTWGEIDVVRTDVFNP